MSWVSLLVFLFALGVVMWCIAAFILDGPSNRQYDGSVGELFNSHPDDGTANAKFLTTIKEIRRQAIQSKSLKKGLETSRKFADNLSNDLVSDTEFSSVSIGNIDAQWAIAPQADTRRRVLLLHGGAFIIGSAVGHRILSDRLSRACNAAVLSVNYRLLPEHSRKAGIRDAQQAYRWIIDNSPSETQACDYLVVAGDSAGGNLALMLSSWSKRNHPRRPDAVLGFSPTLDLSMSSPSFKKNSKTDKILGHSIGKFCYLPRPLLLWLGFILLRAKPSTPAISPLFYDLKDLPPTLIHVSNSEMLLGDAIRYTNKARAAGSKVTLQIWENQLHDWHLFNNGVGSAESAWAEVQKFIESLETNP